MKSLLTNLSPKGNISVVYYATSGWESGRILPLSFCFFAPQTKGRRDKAEDTDLLVRKTDVHFFEYFLPTLLSDSHAPLLHWP